MASFGSTSASLLGRLTPYEVGLCSLLVQHAPSGPESGGQAEQELFNRLLLEVQASCSARDRTLQDLKGALTQDKEGARLWESLQAGLDAVSSPDALFDLFQELEAAISREHSPSSLLHSSGIFGQLARRCILAFRDASFESAVKLYDAVSACRGVELAEPENAGGQLDSQPPVEQLAPRLCCCSPDLGLMDDIALSYGRVPFSHADAVLKVHFLHRIGGGLQHRFADGDGSGGGMQQIRGMPDADIMLRLHSEMRHLDSALRALEEGIHVAQEASDGSFLCVCLYMLSLAVLQVGGPGKAFTMMWRCLHRAESLGLTILQSFCCLGIARTLSTQPSLADRWKESVSRAAANAQPANALRNPNSAPGNRGLGGLGGALPNGPVSRIPGLQGPGGWSGGARGLGVLAALLGHAAPDESGRRSVSGAASSPGEACRDALAHVTWASQLSSQALGPARARVLLCQAEVARLFGLEPLTKTACRLALETFGDELAMEDRTLAMCQLAAVEAARSVDGAMPLLQQIAGQPAGAGRLWLHVVSPELLRMLVRSGEAALAGALLFQAAGAVSAAPPSSAASAEHGFCTAVNCLRVQQRWLAAAYRSSHEALERGARTATLAEVCGHLLCLVEVHLGAGDPVGALGPCMRCLSAAEGARLLQYRSAALVRLAQVKLEMHDLGGALELAEGVTPQLSAGGSAALRGDALLVQADVLFSLATKQRRLEESVTAAVQPHTLLEEAADVLLQAAAEFQAVSGFAGLRRCHYLLARTNHEFGRTRERDRHATLFRQASTSTGFAMKYLDRSGSALNLAVPPSPKVAEL